MAIQACYQHSPQWHRGLFSWKNPGGQAGHSVQFWAVESTNTGSRILTAFESYHCYIEMGLSIKPSAIPNNLIHHLTRILRFPRRTATYLVDPQFLLLV